MAREYKLGLVIVSAAAVAFACVTYHKLFRSSDLKAVSRTGSPVSSQVAPHAQRQPTEVVRAMGTELVHGPRPSEQRAVAIEDFHPPKPTESQPRQSSLPELPQASAEPAPAHHTQEPPQTPG